MNIARHTCRIAVGLVVAAMPWLAAGQSPVTSKAHSVPIIEAKADGKTDDTAAIQKALDAAAKQGGVVRLPAGKYLVAGSLKIPEGVALVGSQSGPGLHRALDRHGHPRHRRPGQRGRPGACSRWATPRRSKG